jgi:signal transduction histidine kinase
MSITAFLRDKLLYVSINLVCLLFITLIIFTLPINILTKVFILVFLIISTLINYVLEFIRKYSFYRNLKKTLSELNEKYLISELMETPSFLEGELLVDVLKAASKSMNDRIATYKIESDEYREYVETWVHEIKNPIASSKLIVENNKSTATQVLDDELTKIELFVEQALFYARSNTVEKDYYIKELYLEDVVKTVLKKHSKLLIQSKASIQLEELHYSVFSDIKWLIFIIGQIITNSVKYKSDNLQLRCYAKRLDHSIILTIEDNGIGISEVELKRVFDKGFTGENGRKYAKSTGIGLYLCKKLCDRMGLDIQLFSIEDIGTKVEIIFPKSKWAILES